MKPLKVLNLYAGIGGNRKYWQDVEVTAVEYDPKIAAVYKEFFPDDTVIVADAHQYLLEHYKEYENGFIWGSPPCPTHSGVNNFLNAQGVIRYPDMSLWQEIIFLQHFCKGKFCIENVKSYYEPFLKPQISGRHYFWANFKIPLLRTSPTIGKMCGKNQTQNRNKLQSDIGRFGTVKSLNGMRTEGRRDSEILDGLSTDAIKLSRKMKNNCCHPDIGLAILNAARGIIADNSVKTGTLFS
jgi:DNA (cytosine-5)-methyltransferase 1